MKKALSFILLASLALSACGGTGTSETTTAPSGETPATTPSRSAST